MSLGNGEDNTTSFASILANVKKLRDSANKIQVENSRATTSSEPRPSNDTTPTTTSTNANSANVNTNDAETFNNLKRARDGTAASLTFRTANQVNAGQNVNQTSANYNTGNKEQLTSFTKTSLYQNHYMRSKNKVQAPVSKIAIHPSQKGNPLIKSLRNIPYEYTSIIKTDYLINSRISVIFLSLKYHKLRPDYIYERLKKFGISSIVDDNLGSRREGTHLKILLLLLDSETNYWDSLQELTKLCIFNDFTLLAAWSFEEAGDYIYLLKNIDSTALLKTKGINDKFDLIKGIQKADYYSRLLETLTSIRSINKTDVSKVASSGNFKNFKELIDDSGGKLELIEGFGNVKLKRFKSTVTEPFVYGKDYDSDPKVLEWKEKCKKMRQERQQKKDQQTKQTAQEALQVPISSPKQVAQQQRSKELDTLNAEAPASE